MLVYPEGTFHPVFQQASIPFYKFSQEISGNPIHLPEQ